MVRRSIEYEVTDSANFISINNDPYFSMIDKVEDKPFVEMETLANQKERFSPFEERLSSARDILVRRVPIHS